MGNEVTAGDLSRRISPQRPSLGEQSTAGDSASSVSDFSDLIEGLDNGGEVVELEARYEIQGPLGSGGMGLVQRAIDRRLQRSVAVKRLKSELAGSRSAARRFLSEAQAVATLNHFNIVQVYDYGYATDGPFIVMELVEGQSLKERLAEGPLEMETAVEVTRQLCDALSVAHGWGIVHRDIKPGNILLTPDGVPKLSDFGLARQERIDEGQTKTGAVLGTLDFMSPEQKRDATSVDPRSDLWSLAATLYQMVTGELPRVIRGDRLDPVLSTVVLKALEDDPESRYESADEFGEALREAVTARAESLLASRFEIAEGSCAHCGAENELTRKFCRGCGKTLHDPCLNCRSILPVWERFCGECGDDVSEKLRQQMATFPAQREEIASLRRSYRYGEAVERLQSLVSLGHSRLSEQSAWAEKAQSIIEQDFSEWKDRREDLLVAAQEHLAVGKDRTARGFLNEIPEPLHTADVVALLKQLETRRDEAKTLALSIRSAVKSRDDATMRPLLERFVELRPGDKQATALLEQLQDRETETVFGEIQSTGVDIASGDDLSYRPELRRRTRRPDSTQRKSLVVTTALGLAVVAVCVVAFNNYRSDHEQVNESEPGQQKVIKENSAGHGSNVVAALKLTIKGHSSSFDSICFSPDGSVIVGGSRDGTVVAWNAETGEKRLSIKGHTSNARTVCFSPDGTRIVSGGFDGTVKVWDAETGQETLKLEGHGEKVISVSFSPDGRRIASGGWGKIIRIWDAETGQETLSLTSHSKTVESVSLSPDGKRIVSGSEDSTVRVWDGHTGKETLTFRGHSGIVYSASFSPDGRRIVSGSMDETIKVWDARTGRELFTTEGHAGWVQDVSFSPDGKLIVSGGNDGKVKVWDADTGQETLTIKDHKGPVISVGFSPDGKRIVSGSEDKTVKVWDISFLDTSK